MRVSDIVSKLDKGYAGRVQFRKTLQDKLSAIRRQVAKPLPPAPAPLVPGSSPLP